MLKQYCKVSEDDKQAAHTKIYDCIHEEAKSSADYKEKMEEIKKWAISDENQSKDNVKKQAEELGKRLNVALQCEKDALNIKT